MLELAVRRANLLSGINLFNGFAGLAWCIEHLRNVDPGHFGDASNSEVDEVILDSLENLSADTEYDLINGLTGLGVYGLERRTAKGDAILRSVVKRLVTQAKPFGPGRVWETPPGRLPRWQRDLYPRGYLNYGLAHGIPGILALLAGIHSLRIEVPGCRTLLEQGLDTLRSYVDVQSGFLPDWYPLDGKPVVNPPHRVAWCYGPLGASIALAQVAVCLGDSDCWDLAYAMAVRTASIPIGASGVVDGGLCHGAAGCARLFSLWYHWTGVSIFHVKAQAYLARTLAFHKPGIGFAGFMARDGGLDEDGKPDFTLAERPEPGLLIGAAGIGLALLSAVGRATPGWGRFLLAPALGGMELNGK